MAGGNIRDSNQGLTKVLFLKQLADFQKFTDPGWEAKQFLKMCF